MVKNNTIPQRHFTSNLFAGRNLLIITKHGKEKILGPIFEKELNTNCVLNNHFDTDSLGTFSGEIERTLDPLAAAMRKCQLGLEASPFDLAIACEGSFGPHPQIPFAYANEEFLVLIDKKNDLCIATRELSLQTNFDAATIKNSSELLAFLKKADFPNHKLIIRKSKTDYTEIEKGISSWTRLTEVFNSLMEKHGSVYVETDMRAMNNPTRMAVIEAATWQLIKKLKKTCPSCQCPGFSVISGKAGLPCLHCKQPSQSLISVNYGCQKCSYTEEVLFPNNIKHADPTYCDFCNP